MTTRSHFALEGSAIDRPRLATFVREFTLPDRPWNGLRRRPSRFAPFHFPLPLLQTLEFEVAVFRALMLKPNRHLFYSRHRTLGKQRWTGAERVSRAALRDGYDYETVVDLIFQIATEKDVAEFRLTPAFAREVVDRELMLLRRQGSSN